MSRAVDCSAPAAGGQRLDVMRRVAVAMFITGGVTAALGAEITARTSEARFAHLWAGGTFVLCGVILLIAPVRRGLVELLLVLAAPVLGLLIAGSNPTGMAPIFYLWPSVFAAYFCSRRLTGLVLALSALTLAGGLAWNGNHDLKVDTFVGAMSSVGLMTVLVATMTRREATLRCELAAMAATDPLTGLLNRRAFDDELESLSSRTGTGGAAVLVVVDLDHFKRFNDQHGHLAGDVALRTVAEALRLEAADDDIVVGRFGGEEFMVALAGDELSRGFRFVDGFFQRLAGLDPRTFHGLTASAGISTRHPDEEPGTAFARADRALYAAKAAGRARYAWYEGDVLSVQDRCPAV